MLPADVARCPGYIADGEWREGCEDCRRRTSLPADPESVWWMMPPALVVFECESRIPPAYEIPAHNLAAPRPAPIPFPVCAGVHSETKSEPVADMTAPLVPAQQAPQKDEPLSAGFDAWWQARPQRIKRVLNPTGFARMVWEAAIRYSRGGA